MAHGPGGLAAWGGGDQPEKIRPLFPQGAWCRTCGCPQGVAQHIHVISVIQQGVGWGMTQHVWPISNPLQPFPALARQGCLGLVSTELAQSDGRGTEVLTVDATHLKAQRPAATRGPCTWPDGWPQGGLTSKLHGVWDSKGGPLRLRVSGGLGAAWASGQGANQRDSGPTQ